ncbi:MAG: hypothetical protein ACLFPL_00110 [Candidatus Nanoarchaeia archaeon]
MGTFSFLKNTYFIAIATLSVFVALIMVIQTQNEWYVPQHPSCNSIEYEAQACSKAQTIEIELFIPPNSPDLVFRNKEDSSLGELEGGRSITVEQNKSQSVEIIPHRDSYKCSKESTTFELNEIELC